jgi:hypothetical protein
VKVIAQVPPELVVADAVFTPSSCRVIVEPSTLQVPPNVYAAPIASGASDSPRLFVGDTRVTSNSAGSSDAAGDPKPKPRPRCVLIMISHKPRSASIDCYRRRWR